MKMQSFVDLFKNTQTKTSKTYDLQEFTNDEINIMQIIALETDIWDYFCEKSDTTWETTKSFSILKLFKEAKKRILKYKYDISEHLLYKAPYRKYNFVGSS